MKYEETIHFETFFLVMIHCKISLAQGETLFEDSQTSEHIQFLIVSKKITLTHLWKLGQLIFAPIWQKFLQDTK